MRNPYEILGVRDNATEEEIKKAYRQLVKKFHPDQYRDHPLSGLAEEKLAEINQAYDILAKNNNAKRSSGASSTSQGNNWYGNSDNSLFNEVRRNLNIGNIRMAEELLNNCQTKNAQWYFLKGVVSLKKGWYDQAFENMKMAVDMEPSNMEYQSALNNLNSSNNMYRERSFGRGYNQGPDICTICSCLWCLDCCCGGSLLGCC